MGLFTLDDKPVAQKTPDEQKAESIRGLSDFHSLSEVAKAAPTTDEMPETRATTRREKTTQTKREQEAALKEKEERKQRALKVVGKRLVRRAATIPYDAWAFLASDPAYQLSNDELTELTEAYQELLEVLSPDLSGPIFIGLSILAAHGEIVSKRFIYANMKADAKKKGLPWPPPGMTDTTTKAGQA